MVLDFFSYSVFVMLSFIQFCFIRKGDLLCPFSCVNAPMGWAVYWAAFPLPGSTSSFNLL